MKRGKFVLFIRKFCALLVFCVCVFTAGYTVGLRGSINRYLQGARDDVQANAGAQGAARGAYSAILSGKWIYVYNETGALYDAVYVYTEYMTEEDKSALAGGLTFQSEAEMSAFMENFR